MRKLTDHIVSGLNEKLEISVLDLPGLGGATFLITTPFNKKAIKSFSGATELVSTATKPSKHDAVLIKKANEILAA